MMVNLITSAPPTHVDDWKSIQWKKVKSQVKQLQKRIAKATQAKQYGKVKALQRLLTHSFCAKTLALKRVTSNADARTAGIDRSHV